MGKTVSRIWSWYKDELQIYPLDYLNLNGSVEHMHPFTLQNTVEMVIRRTNLILDTLATEYTQ